MNEILNYIFDNRPRRITQEELSRKFPVSCHVHEEGTRNSKKESTLRQIRQIIRDLRLAGHPILSDVRGYWYPVLEKKDEEVAIFIEGFKRRAKASAGAYFQTVNAFKGHLPDSYQPSLEL